MYNLENTIFNKIEVKNFNLVFKQKHKRLFENLSLLFNRLYGGLYEI